MTKNKENKMVVVEEVPIPQSSSVISVEQKQNSTNDNSSYVVVRYTCGLEHRVSNVEHDSPNNPAAIEELELWNRICSNAKDGTSAKIVKYEKNKHRIW
jgi:hypothetical protein